MNVIRFLIRIFTCYWSFSIGEEALATLVAGLGSAAISATGNAITTNVKSKKAYRHTKQLMKLQNEYQNENWLKQNERQDWLNSNMPSIRKSAYKMAGMNPALAMADGAQFSNAVGSVGGVSSSPMPEYTGTEFSPLAMLADLPLKIQQLKNLEATEKNIDADTENKETDTGLKLSQTEKTTIESAQSQLQLTRDLSLDDQLKAIYGEDANKGTIEGLNIFYDNKTKEQEFQTVSHRCLAEIAEYDWRETFALLKSAHPEYGNALLAQAPAQLNQLIATTALTRAQALTEHSQQVLNYVNADTNAMNREKARTEIDKLRTETDSIVLKQGFDSWYFNHDNKKLLVDFFGEDGYKNIQGMKEVYNCLITPLKDGAQILRDTGIGIGSFQKGIEKPSVIPKVGFTK